MVYLQTRVWLTAQSDTASDSGIDTDMTSEYTSINSTNYQFHEEEGRRSSGQWEIVLTLTYRFHGMDAPYNLPNDDDELSRLHVLHHYHKAYHEVNILAPLPQNPSLIGNTYTVLSRLISSWYWYRIWSLVHWGSWWIPILSSRRHRLVTDSTDNGPWELRIYYRIPTWRAELSNW